MTASNLWRWLIFAGFAFSAATLAAGAGSASKQDRSWKRYYNSQWGYCLSYPARWRKGDAFEGSGIFIESGVKRLSVPLGEIDVAVLPKGPQLTLIDDAQLHLDGLKKFEHAEDMEQIEQRHMDLLGNSALFTKSRYYDRMERARWVDEIIFARRQDALFRLELECRADQLTRFEAVFSRLLSTFQFNCAVRN